MKWCVYMMLADAGGGDSFCKIGVTSDLANRVRSVQTGCPMPITDVAYLELPAGRHMEAERMFHHRLARYRTQGEWFRMNLADPEHKEAMADATRRVVGLYGASETRWKHMDLDAVRLLCKALRLDKAA